MSTTSLEGAANKRTPTSSPAPPYRLAQRIAPFGSSLIRNASAPPDDVRLVPPSLKSPLKWPQTYVFPAASSATSRPLSSAGPPNVAAHDTVSGQFEHPPSAPAPPPASP